VVNPLRSSHRRTTLALTTVLHAFTHAFGSMLVPLYLLIVADLKLGGVRDASFIVTVYGLTYCLMSFAAGIVADRFDRKNLLGLGLIGNAIAIGLMGVTHAYWPLVALAVLAGVSGSLFHPSANALVTEHYPRAPGMAIGLLGIGAGIGFFVGPQYAGWRADSATWQIAHLAVANWQRPCVEMGVAGVVCGIAFLLFAREARGHHPALSAVSISGATSPGGPKLAPAISTSRTRR
jgi:MFS family permease